MKIAGKEVWTEEDDEKAREMFAAGVPVKEIAEAVGRNSQAVYYRNNRRWRIDRKKVTPGNWTKKEDALAQRFLREGMPYKHVAEELGRSLSAVKLRNNQHWRITVVRANAVWTNDSYFDSWSAEMAYILGFIAADGNVSRDRDRLTITQSHAAGNEHLLRIRTHIGGNVCGPDKNDSNQLICYSRPMVTRLMELGVTPRKSLTAQLSPGLPDEYLRAYILGLFDGDGCVSRCHKKNEKPDIRATIASGSPVMRDQLLKAIEDATGLSGSVRKIEVTYRNSKARAFLEWLYTDHGRVPYSPVKYDKYQALLVERQAWGPDRRALMARRSDGTFLPGQVSA